MKLFSVTFVCLISAAVGAHVNSVDEESQPRKAPSYFGDIKYLYRTYQDCAAADLSTCLKLKLFTIIDRVARSNSDFKLYEGVTFVKDGEDQPDTSAPKTESELEASLPRALDDKEHQLNTLIMDKIMSYFGSHTLKVKFPTAEEMKRSIEEVRKGGGGGGGGKDKKNGHYIMIPLLLGSTLIPLAFGALAILAGKALIVSKLALALASIIGIKKLISGGHHHEGGAHEVVVSGGHASGGWGRNLKGEDLPYKGQH